MSSVVKDEHAVCARGSVTVVVRVRGQNAKEAGMPIVTKVIDDKVVVFDPKPDTSSECFYGKKRQFRDLNKRQNKNALFQFDRVFDETSSSLDIFETATKDVIIDVLNGYNACVFAYGATGAGKTFTMLGTAENPGVTFLSVMSLYERIGHSTDKTYDIVASYLEVYNEQIRDLLIPGAPLALREDACGDVVSTGLSLHKINSAAELLHMLEFGNKNRTQHPTDANAESSRSHAVFQVYVKQRDRTANTTTNIKVGKLSLIDLAGSERATVTTNRGARFREGANINRSLLALGNCINALADGKSKGYVPYRNSKLTRLLKDSLGGNCRTVMIAAISPSSLTYEDTYNTLRYANRAKEIKVDLKQNNLSVEYHISQYPKMIQELRDQVTELKVKLSEYESGNHDKIISVTEKPSSNICTEYESRFKEALQKVFDKRVSIRKELMELEGSEKVLGLKILKKEITLNRLSLLVNESDHDKTIGELQRSISAARQRVTKIGVQKLGLNKKMIDNALELDRIEAELKSTLPTNSDIKPELLELVLQCRHLEVELRDSRQQVKYLKKISRIQQREAVASEKLISKLLKFARHNHYVLKGHGLATIESTNEFTCIQRLLRGSSEVVWQDSTEAQLKDGLNGVTFEKLLQFPTLGYKLTPTCQSVCPVYNTQQSRTCEISTADRQIGLLPPSTVLSLPSPVQSIVGVTTDDDSDGDSNTCDNSINNATFTLASSKHLGSPASFHQTPAASAIADPHSSSQTSPFCPSVFIGKLTFSDCTKSSAVASSARSPLKACHNVMQTQASTVSRKRSAASQDVLNTKSAPICDGPAVNIDKSNRPLTDTFVNGQAKPSYMQMTRAATHRQQTFPSTRSLSVTDDAKRPRYQAPGRVPLPQFSKPNRMRSSSANVQFGVPSSSYQRKGILF